MEEDIQKYSPSVMFRGTPCSFGLLPQGYCEGKTPLILKRRCLVFYLLLLIIRFILIVSRSTDKKSMKEQKMEFMFNRLNCDRKSELAETRTELLISVK